MSCLRSNHWWGEGTWHWLWLVAFVGGTTWVVRDTQTASDSPIAWYVLHRLAAGLLIGVVVLRAVVDHPKVPFRGVFGWFTLLGLWNLGSTAWSVFPAWTAYRSIEYLVLVWLAAYTAYSVTTARDLERWANLVFFWIAALIIAVWLGAVIAPARAFRPSSFLGNALLPVSLHGVLPAINANSVGMYAGVLGLVSGGRFLQYRRRAWLVVFVVSLVTMCLAQGRSAWLGFAVGAVLLIILRRQYVLAVVLTVALCCVVYNYRGTRDFAWDYFRRGQSVDQFSRFSGRRSAWEYTYAKVARDARFTGFGAYAGGRFAVLPEIGGWSSLHSGWLETLAGSGFIGVTLLAAGVVRTWLSLVRAAWRAYGDRQQYLLVELAAILGLISVRSVFSDNFAVHNDFLAWLCIGTAACVGRGVLHSVLPKRVPEVTASGQVEERFPCVKVPAAETIGRGDANQP